MNYLLQKLMRNGGYMDEAKGDGDGSSGGSGAPEGKAGDGKTDDGADGSGGGGDPKLDDSGSKKPTDEEAKLLKEVMQKKDALKKTESDLAAAQARLKEFDGVDPAKIRKLLADQEAAETAALEAKGDFERVKQRMVEEHTRVNQSLQDQITALQAQLAGKEKVVDELSIGQQFTQSEFITKESTMAPAKARKLFGDHFDVVDGAVVAFDKPRGEANRTALVDQYGNGVAFEEAMRKIVEADPDRDTLLKSKVKPGAGSESKPVAKAPVSKDQPTDSVSKITAGLSLANLLAEQPK